MMIPEIDSGSTYEVPGDITLDTGRAMAAQAIIAVNQRGIFGVGVPEWVESVDEPISSRGSQDTMRIDGSVKLANSRISSREADAAIVGADGRIVGFEF